jgi:hypothetical protein
MPRLAKIYFLAFVLVWVACDKASLQFATCKRAWYAFFKKLPMTFIMICEQSELTNLKEIEKFLKAHLTAFYKRLARLCEQPNG